MSGQRQKLPYTSALDVVNRKLAGGDPSTLFKDSVDDGKPRIVVCRASRHEQERSCRHQEAEMRRASDRYRTRSLEYNSPLVRVGMKHDDQNDIGIENRKEFTVRSVFTNFDQLIKRTKVVLYLRVSGREQRSHLQVYEWTIRQMAVGLGIKVVAKFEAVAHANSDEARATLAFAVERARSVGAAGVVGFSVSRFARADAHIASIVGLCDLEPGDAELARLIQTTGEVPLFVCVSARSTEAEERAELSEIRKRMNATKAVRRKTNWRFSETTRRRIYRLSLCIKSSRKIASILLEKYQTEIHFTHVGRIIRAETTETTYVD